MNTGLEGDHTRRAALSKSTKSRVRQREKILLRRREFY